MNPALMTDSKLRRWLSGMHHSQVRPVFPSSFAKHL